MAYDVWQSCMLLPVEFKRSDCASWVQAWGSIAAVVGALFVAFYVPLRQMKADRRQALWSAAAFATALVPALRGIRRAVGESKHGAAVGVKYHVQTASDMGAIIRLDLIPLDLLPSVMGLRSLAAEAQEFLAQLEKGEELSDKVLPYLDNLVTTAEQHRQKLLSA
ncbi:hypothetical protein ABIC89_002535 [Variovorax boronicumulans]|uniref:hypothetical protein n=1 Tax=Variovorax boronicumulans TaxID=436515 RepID=UPI0033960C50